MGSRGGKGEKKTVVLLYHLDYPRKEINRKMVGSREGGIEGGTEGG